MGLILKIIGFLFILAILVYSGILGWTLEVVGHAIWSMGRML